MIIDNIVAEIIILHVSDNDEDDDNNDDDDVRLRDFMIIDKEADNNNYRIGLVEIVARGA